MSVEKPKAIKVFYCYSHEDKDLRNELERHLGAIRRLGLITEWCDREIEAGTEWEKEIEEQLNTAGIILLLISSDFIHSDYCYSKEMQQALKLHKNGRARTIPIILRPVDWQDTPVAQLQVLPSDGKPVTSSYWNSRDEAFYDVAKGIRKAVNSLLSQSQQKQRGQSGLDTLSSNRRQSNRDVETIPWEALPRDVREEILRRQKLNES